MPGFFCLTFTQRLWFTDQITLQIIHAQLQQARFLRFAFDIFRHHAHLFRPRHLDNRFHHDGVQRVREDVADEAAVNLNDIGL